MEWNGKNIFIAILFFIAIVVASLAFVGNLILLFSGG
jgi:hypothetical protein